jgi:L-malate glycosyltransferase
MSNLRPVKRVPDALRVLAATGDRRIKLLILAGGPFDEYRPLARELGIANRLIVRNDVVDIENYIQAADAGLYTSEKESFGMGVLETMSFGKPVIATGVGGVSEIVQDRKSGFLERLGDVENMASDVLRLASDPELAARVGAAARERAQRDFSPEKSVAHYVDYYRSILSARP